MTTTQTTQRWRNGRWVPGIALIAVLASGAWLFTQQSGSGWNGSWSMSSSGGTNLNWNDGGMMSGDSDMMGDNGSGGMMSGDSDMMGDNGSGGMMGGYGWSNEGAEPVDNLSQARDRAAEYAEVLQSGLEVGEVMRFENHYYADLQEPDGTKVTEVLIDPLSGAVRPEMGPAMMWNTGFGAMGRGLNSDKEITATQAQQIADRWLADRDGGLTSEDPAQFPGYYTLHTVKDGEIIGMLSVHAGTGDVWYHSWHDGFVEMSEHA